MATKKAGSKTTSPRAAAAAAKVLKSADASPEEKTAAGSALAQVVSVVERERVEPPAVTNADVMKASAEYVSALEAENARLRADLEEANRQLDWHKRQAAR